MTESRGGSFRTIKGRWLLGSFATGALVGLALHLSDQRLFPWWAVITASFASVFALGAYFRRARWEEESAAAMLATFFLVLPIAARSLWFWMCMVIVMLGYRLLMAAVQAQREPKDE